MAKTYANMYLLVKNNRINFVDSFYHHPSNSNEDLNILKKDFLPFKMKYIHCICMLRCLVGVSILDYRIRDKMREG